MKYQLSVNNQKYFLERKGSTADIYSADRKLLQSIELSKETMGECKSIKIGDQYFVKALKEHFAVTLEPEGTASNTTEFDGKIRCPMTGKITKVLSTSGDQVLANKTILIMEAMKMQYELSSPVDAKIIKLNIQEGQQVQRGDILVELSS